MINMVIGLKRHLLLLVATIVLSLMSVGLLCPEPVLADQKKKITYKKKQKAPAKGKTTAKAKTIAKAGKNNKNKTPSKGPDPLDLPWPDNVLALAGQGAVVVADFHESDSPRELFAHNADRTYVPASILKLVTAGASLETLGPGYRFKTDFYLTRSNDLWIVGHGDPFLVSEELCTIVSILKESGLEIVNNIYLDSSFFMKDLVLDGTSYSLNPYDAFNGALGVNFNTVNYLIDRSGRIVESNDCSPITPLTLKLAGTDKSVGHKRKGIKEVRLNISDSPAQAEEHAGEMFKALLEKFGIKINGKIISGLSLPKGARLLYSHKSSRDLSEMVRELLEHSNNYVTNQIFLTMGAEVYGAPATEEKSRRAVYDYLERHRLSGVILVEGSGLSRQNQVTAHQMINILGVFERDRNLVKMKGDGSVYYKTGTMTDVQTLAGYLVRPSRPDEPLSFVILLNGSYKPGTREKILQAIKSHFVDELETI